MKGKKGFQCGENHWHWKGGKIKTNCPCGKIVESHKGRLKKYCSRQCYTKFNVVWNKGKQNVFSEKTLRKMRLAKVGKPSLKKGKKYPQYGGKNHWRWSGGIYRQKSGYVSILSPHHPYKGKNGYVAEHRLVMEKKIKRFLKAHEIVHHINGIKNDNRIENLILCKNRKEHNKYHAKIICQF